MIVFEQEWNRKSSLRYTFQGPNRSLSNIYFSEEIFSFSFFVDETSHVTTLFD